MSGSTRAQATDAMPSIATGLGLGAPLKSFSKIFQWKSPSLQNENGLALLNMKSRPDIKHV